MNENEQNDIKEIGDENRDQIIDDVDIIEENNICNENEKSKNEEENEKKKYTITITTSYERGNPKNKIIRK